MSYLKLASAACLVLLACGAAPKVDNPADGNAGGGGPSERVFGTIEHYGEPAQLEVPGSVEQGQPFTVNLEC